MPTISSDHFSVDGTMIEVWSSMKSFRPNDAARDIGRRRKAKSGGSLTINGRTARHQGYATSFRIRKRIEEAFGWMKTIGGMRRPMLRGTDRVGWSFTLVAAAYNLVRLPKLLVT